MRIEFEQTRQGPEGNVVLTFTCRELGSLSEHDGLQIHVGMVGKLRDERIASIGPGALEEGRTETATLSLEPGLYEIFAADANGPNRQTRIAHAVEGRRWFAVPPVDNPLQQVIERRAERSGLLRQPQVAANTMAAAKSFQAVVFYSGVSLRNPQILAGVEVVPLESGIGIAGLDEAVTSYLQAAFGKGIVFSELAESDFERANPMFAVRFHDIRSDDMEGALRFAKRFAHDVATIIAMERGERPILAATFIRDEAGYSLWGATHHYRGNLADPMFATGPAHLIEHYQPILAKSDYARLVMELLAQAIGERNAAFQHFRYWALLEQIAKKYVVDNATKLSHPDGAPIPGYKPGSQETTQFARGKVYKYLIDNKTPAERLVKPAEDGRSSIIEGAVPLSVDPEVERIRLWDALGGAIELRNQVAHKGHFNTDPPKNNVELMARRLVLDRSPSAGFVQTLASAAAIREIEGES